MRVAFAAISSWALEVRLLPPPRVLEPDAAVGEATVDLMMTRSSRKYQYITSTVRC